MEKNTPKDLNISESDCYDYIDSHLFKLRPKDYCIKYPKWPGMVGIEVEMMAFQAGSLKRKPIPIKLFGDGPSVSNIFEESLFKDPDFIPVKDPKGSLISVKVSENEMLTFEPGGQIEFSTKPYPCFMDADVRVRAVQKKIGEVLRKYDFELMQLGINPWLHVDEIGLQMSKPRYRAMNEFFGNISEFGARMMRQTGTLQVNLDFGQDETLLAKRYLVSYLLAPYATSIFSNSPISDNKLTEYKSFRSMVWQKLDPSRTGFPNLKPIVKNQNKKECVNSYFEFAMDAKVTFIEKLNFKVPTDGLTFKDWISKPINGLAPTLTDFETHLSLLFPEVRPKGFMEIRSIDCPFKAFQSVPSQFYCSLIYTDKVLDEALDLLIPELANIESLWKKSSFGFGLDKDFDNKTKKLANLASEGLSYLPPCFISPDTKKTFQYFIENFTLQGKTQADEIIEIYRKNTKNYFDGYELLQLEEKWQKELRL